MSRGYGSYTNDFELDCEWATLDVTVHWTLDSDHYRDFITIDKITVGGKDLHEGWNIDYFEALIESEVLESDHSDTVLPPLSREDFIE